MKRGSILVGLLWCIVLLSVVVVGVLHASRLDLLVAKNQGDQIQAHYLALAGIEKAKALLFLDARERRRSAQTHNGALWNSPESFENGKLGRGHFRVVRRGRVDEGGGLIFGIEDEESRLNLNACTTNELMHLPGMTPDVAAAINDWRDEDNTVSPGGAEADYYVSLQPPCLPRNGPFLTVRELLMVRGVSPELLLGEDREQNDLVSDRGESDARRGAGRQALEDSGWSAWLTVSSTSRNINAAGEDRVDINTADQKALTEIKGITPAIAQAIMAYRGQRQFNSIAELLDVTAQVPGSTQVIRTPFGTQTVSAGGGNGPKVISPELLADIADFVTTSAEQEVSGLININSASLNVLICLDGLDPQLAQAIISHRKSAGFFSSIAGLLKVPGIDPEIFKRLAPRITARSDTFRITAEGKVDSTGARKRLQAIVRLGATRIKTLAWREDM